MDSRSSLSRLLPDVVTKSLTPSQDGSRRRRFLPETPSPRAISNTSSRIWCRGLNNPEIVYKITPHQNVSNTVALEERTIELDEGQAGSDPGNTLESRPPPDEDQAGSNPGQSHVALHPTKEHVFLENLPSSSGTLSSMKNLDDAFTFGDQFIDDKPTKEETDKANVESEVESMVTVPIHQASSSAPTLSTPIIELTTPKPKIYANFQKRHKLQDKTSQAFSSRVFTLDNHDLYSKIDNYVNETVKEVVQNTLHALVCECFRELSEFEMKEILRDRMFESGPYRSQPEHAALYDTLEASMDRENREEFIEATTKSRKRRRDDQDPSSPPLKDLDQSKKKRHDSDASALKQPQAQTSSA
ncbi:hypothetical protein Tco_1189740 [Tanacetum coccineum]